MAQLIEEFPKMTSGTFKSGSNAGDNIVWIQQKPTLKDNKFK